MTQAPDPGVRRTPLPPPPPPLPQSASASASPPPPTGELGDVPSRRLHPLSLVASAAVALLRSWPIVLIAAARSSWAAVGVLAVVLVAWRAVVWLRTTYSVDAGGLVVRSGLLWRNTQVVPPQRVQQVELRRGLRHRVLGLAVVRVGLAGGGDTTEVALDALSSADAERLGATLERWRTSRAGAAGAGRPTASESAQGTTTDGPTLPPPVVAPTVERRLLTVGPGELVIAGLTSRSLWLIPLAAFAGFVQLVSDARLESESTDALRSTIADTSPVVLIAVVMVLSIVAAAVGTVVRNYGLNVVRRDDDVVVARGLLEQRSVTVPRARVQLVEVASHVLRRRIGLAALEIRTADLGGNSGTGETSTSIPIGRRDELDGLVGELLPTVVIGDVRRHPAAAVRRAVVRRTFRLVPLAAAIGVVVGGAGALPVSIGAGLAVAVPSGWATGRSLRSGSTSSAVVVEFGAIAWRRWVVPVSRIQSVGVVQDPFQRRLGLASVRLDVAGSVGGVIVRDVDVDRAGELAAELGLRAPLAAANEADASAVGAAAPGGSRSQRDATA